MKTIVILSTPFIVFASGETLTPFEHMSIHNSNQRPLVKMQNKRKMHRLHKVNEEQAAQIVKEQTQEEVTSMKLDHTGKYLIYKATTDRYRLTINALDGTVMKKALKK